AKKGVFASYGYVRMARIDSMVSSEPIEAVVAQAVTDLAGDYETPELIEVEIVPSSSTQSGIHAGAAANLRAGRSTGNRSSESRDSAQTALEKMLTSLLGGNPALRAYKGYESNPFGYATFAAIVDTENHEILVLALG